MAQYFLVLLPTNCQKAMVYIAIHRKVRLCRRLIDYAIHIEYHAFVFISALVSARVVGIGPS